MNRQLYLLDDYELSTHPDKLKLEVQKSLDETQQLFDSLMQEYLKKEVDLIKKMLKERYRMREFWKKYWIYILCSAQ